MLVTSSKKVTMEDIYNKYPNFDSEYKITWRSICKRCLASQVSRNRNSSRLSGIIEELRNSFPNLNSNELRAVSKSLSSKFRNNLGFEDWNPWRNKLPKIFEGSEFSQGNLMTIFKTDSDGLPKSISQVSEEINFVITVCSENGEQVFKMSVPKEIAMTSISEITKALA